ncbi:hypothetical protein NP493_1114g00056 [Ridgeia piscesae]|uniref:Uncharacterized protein n=1 Tax=Ridgeia piscesae TaxID=27915 RepID=A0AAD9KH29_RIDPI|nr:hypothetical protein NP493_1114g00056 [Ridgeia piscesae]
MAMLQLEKEMTAEMQKQRELLNREHEDDLQRELIEHKKSFLSQLAAISNMTKDEVSRLVSEVVTDSGGSSKEAKKLTKELKTGMEHAKTDMALDEEDEDGYSNSSGSEDEDDRDHRRRRKR